MKSVQIFADQQQLAEAAAAHAIMTLKAAIAAHGNATWVLAGGTAPTLAYQIISEQYLDSLDWSHVTFALGDERIGALNGPDNNWHAIDQVFLKKIPQASFLRPQSDLSAEEAAADYIEQLSAVSRFDLVWLGMGEDGHTLSLFPGHPELTISDQLVVAVHNSPKPPADRISLTLGALEKTETCVILTAGAGKAAAIHQAFETGDLPVALAAASVEAHGGTVTWLCDQAAYPQDSTASR